ncbi:MAG: hypothetical protein MJB14_05235 [Spirochaetes bacterium]|nr:hypothetical protein [Spirochaetota bacterium]
MKKFLYIVVLITLILPLHSFSVLNNSFIDYTQDFTVFHFDTEERVLFWLLDKDGGFYSDQKINVYRADGSYLDSVVTDERGFFKIKNNQYQSLMIKSETGGRSYRILLNSIQKTDYHVFCVYDKQAGRLSFNGIIQGKSKIKAGTQLFISVADGHQLVISKSTDISNNGYFDFELDTFGLNKNFYQLKIIINGKIIKQYQLYLNDSEYQIYNSEIKNSTQQTISVDKKVIFDDNQIKVNIEKSSQKIDSIFCTIKLNDLEIGHQIIDKVVSNQFLLKLPEYSEIKRGEYLLEFEIIYRDGSSVTEKVSLEKASDIDDHLVFVFNEYNNQQLNNNTLYCPFDKARTLMVTYSKDIIDYKVFWLEKGNNKVKFDTSITQNHKILLILEDIVTHKSISYLFHPKIEEKLIPVQFDVNLSGQQYQLTNSSAYLNKKSAFLYFTPQDVNQDPLLSHLNSFFDFTYPNETLNDLYTGKLIYIRDYQFNQYRLFDISHKLFISYSNPRNNIFSFQKKYDNQNKIEVSAVFPDKITVMDIPQITFFINNFDAKAKTLTFKLINSQDENFKFQQRIQLKPYDSQQLNIKLNLQDKVGTSRINYTIFDDDRLIYSGKRSILVKERLQTHHLVALTGKITYDKISKSFLKLPNNLNSECQFNIYLSPYDWITGLSKSFQSQNLHIEVFELELLKFLESFYLRKYQFQYQEKQFLNKYYQRQQGIKKYSTANQIDWQSSLLLLFASSIIDELLNYEEREQLSKYLIANYKQEILKSPLAIFVFSQLGVFFEEINKRYLEEITDNVLFFYPYYMKYQIKKSFDQKDKNIIDVTYQEQKINESFYKIIQGFYEIDSQPIIQGLNNTTIEKIFFLLLSLKKEKSKSKVRNTNLFVNFSSDFLPSFRDTLKSNDIIIKQYHISKEKIKNYNKELIDFSLEKKGVGTLYYLIEYLYQGNYSINQQSLITGINSTILNDNYKPIDLNDHPLKKDHYYYLKIDFINNSSYDQLFFRVPYCSGLSFQIHNITCNSQSSPEISGDTVNVLLPQIKQGRNSIIIPFQAKYSGTFQLEGGIFYNWNDATLYIKDQDFNLVILN